MAGKEGELLQRLDLGTLLHLAKSASESPIRGGATRVELTRIVKKSLRTEEIERHQLAGTATAIQEGMEAEEYCTQRGATMSEDHVNCGKCGLPVKQLAGKKRVGEKTAEERIVEERKEGRMLTGAIAAGIVGYLALVFLDMLIFGLLTGTAAMTWH